MTLKTSSIKWPKSKSLLRCLAAAKANPLWGFVPGKTFPPKSSKKNKHLIKTNKKKPTKCSREEGTKNKNHQTANITNQTHKNLRYRKLAGKGEKQNKPMINMFKEIKIHLKKQAERRKEE